MFILRTALLLALAVSTATAQTLDEVKSDPALRAKVSVSAKYSPLPYLLKSLAKQSGVQVQSATALSDLKVTAFVKDVPLGLLMDKIAKVLDATWINDSGIRILEFSSAQRVDRNNYLTAESKFLRARAETEARAMAAAANEPLEDFMKAMQTSPLETNPNQPPPSILPPVRQISVEDYTLAKLFRSWDSGQWDSFWNGEIVVAPAVVAEPRPPVPLQDPGADPSGLPGQFPPRRRPMPPLPATASWIFARYDAFGEHSIQVSNSSGGLALAPSPLPTLLTPEGKLAETPFGKQIAAWSNLDEAGTDPAFQRPLEPKKSLLNPFVNEEGVDTAFADPRQAGPFNPNKGLELPTLSDHLEKLFDQTGIPVVCDGFRIPPPVTETRIPGVDAKSYLTAMKQTDSCFVKVEDGFAMVRQGGFWRLRASEIPEKTILPLATKFAKALAAKRVATPEAAANLNLDEVARESLTLSDYIGFCSQLTPAQAASLRAFNPPSLGFPVERIRDAVPALQFMAALGGLPALDTAVRYQAMDAQTQELFMRAIRSSMFWGAAWKGRGPTGQASGFGFVMSAANISEPQGLTSGLTFLFGSSSEDGITYDAVVTPG